MREIRRSIVAALFLAATSFGLNAQVQPGHAIVASDTGGRTTLYDLDMATGKHVTLARFPGDTAAPLAVVVDPVSLEIYVAVDAGSGRTLCYRLRYSGTRLVASRVVSTSTGTVTGLVLAERADLFLTDTVGVARLPRFGPLPARLLTAPRASALSAFDTQAPYAWIAQSGSTSAAPQIRLLDLMTGKTVSGPHAYKGFTSTITGVAELPTGLVRHLITDSQGRLSLSVNFAVPVPLATTPTLPPGATRALRVDISAIDSYVLGGKQHPYIEKIRGWSAQPWQRIGGPFGGDPVDFDVLLSSSSAVESFGGGCDGGAAHAFALRMGNAGPPKLGNLNFSLVATQAPLGNAPIAFALGVQEIRPVTLPGACELRTSLDIVFGHVTDQASSATQAIPIPNTPSLRGVTFFAQWLQPYTRSGFQVASSNGAAVHIR